MKAPTIKATNITLTDELREYALQKFAAACDAFIIDSPTAVSDIELEHAPVRDGDQYRTELTVQVDSDLYRAEAWDQTMHGSVDRAVEKLSKELRRHKGKRKRKERDFLRGVKNLLRGW